MDETRFVQTLQGLLDTSRALGSEVELDSLLNVIVRRASLIMEADRTTVFVKDHSTNRLWSRVGEGLEAGTIELDVGSGIAGEVAQTGNTINIPDAQVDPRFNPEFDRRSGYQTRSVLCSPILNGDGRLLGVVQSINKKSGSPFDDEDERVMEALASHVGVALERAQLTEASMEKGRFDAALRLASEIQMGMVPGLPIAGDLSNHYEIGAVLRPARHVGGDFYDFQDLEDGRLFFCIGEVAARGIPAALMMAVTRTLFRANAFAYVAPEKIVYAVNRQLCQELAPSMFVTAFCGILDHASMRLLFSNAGHSAPILCPLDGEPREVEAGPGLALGLARDYNYTCEEVALNRGDLLFLSTDGIPEAVDDRGATFTTRRILDLLPAIASEHPSRIVDLTLSAVDEFAGGVPQLDDLAAVCIRVTGADRPDRPD